MRERRTAIGFALAALLVASAAARAHYVDLDGALVEPGVFTFGVALVGRPFAQRVDGVIGGFEVDVAGAVAEAHGLRLEVVALPRDRIGAALAAHEVDAASTIALGDLDASLALVPYVVLGDHLMVLRGNPFRVRGVEDLAGRTVSVTSGTSAERFAHRLNRELEAAGRAPMNVHSFALDRFTHFPVSMGHAAGYFVSTVRAVGISRDPESRTTMVESVFSPVREAGFAVRRDRTHVVHALEHAVAAMVATGKLARVRARHGLPAALDPYPRDR